MKIAVTLCLLLGSILSYAQEWVRQNPFANLSLMYDVDFDGRYGLAVGADATIFTTTDRGITWVPRKASPFARTIESAKVVPGTMGQVMMAGGDSILMLTENGGELWKTSYVEVPNIYKIQVLPGNVYLALGKDFGIYSTDGGLLWQPFNMPAFGVTAGHFVSTQKGWIALGEEDNVQIWYTDDRGFNWEIRDPQLFPKVTGIEMINDTVGYLASRDFVYKTIDGGYHWWPLHTVPTNDIEDLYVIDENNLWTSLGDGSIYFSNIGGSVWEEKNTGLYRGNRTTAIWADLDGHVWTVGKYMSILYSPDFGQTWSDQLPGNKQTLYEANFYNPFVGMVGASDGAILKTNTSGSVWEVVQLPKEESFYGITMLDDSVVVAGSASGKVMISSDQGNNWKEIGVELGQISDLHAFSQNHIMVATKEGDIFKTLDAGQDWTQVYDGAYGLVGMTFFNNSLAWATGLSGHIIMTSDGGNTWNLRTNDFPNEFSDAFFTSPTEGWITSAKYADSLWHTQDAGLSWRKIGLPIKSYWNSVAFMDRDTGWVVGGEDGTGLILRTNDKGLTWFLDHTSPDIFNGLHVIPHSETVWAVGYGGNIMKYSSCASPPSLTDLRGNLEPCVGDTINYIAEFTDVDFFEWAYPSDWHVVGNTNTSSIHFIAGSSSGSVTVMGSDACGDTTMQISAVVNPVITPVVRIRKKSGEFISNTPPGLYQWLFNGVPIPGANLSTYTPTQNGTYQLLYTTFTSGCEGYSNTVRFSLQPVAHTPDPVMIFPNPAGEFITVQQLNGESFPPEAKISLTNINGQVVLTANGDQEEINISALAPGFYMVMVRTADALHQEKIMKE
jgi:photosystem II stability/assembly factor-like uncharacterized protein